MRLRSQLGRGTVVYVNLPRGGHQARRAADIYQAA
jgi:hypothetical protein